MLPDDNFTTGGDDMTTITHADIFAEVRAYLLGLFSCPSLTIIQNYRQGMALSDQAIVMSILSEQALDVAANYYQPATNKVYVQQSVEIKMLIDFYGEAAADRALKLCNLWQNVYSTERLRYCQPLYCLNPKFVADTNQSEITGQYWQVELTLQYNPEFELDQTYLGMPEITLTKP